MSGRNRNTSSKTVLAILIAAVLLVSGSVLLANGTRLSPPVWSVDPSSYQFNMSFLIRAKFDGGITNDPGNMVGVFSGNELRGVGNTVNIGGEMFFFISAYSNSFSGDPISFKLYYAAEDMVYATPETSSFLSNSIIGNLSAPFWINASSTADYPPAFSVIPADTTLLTLPFEPVVLSNYLVSQDGDVVVYSVIPGNNLNVLINGDTLVVVPDNNWTGTSSVTIIGTEQTSGGLSATAEAMFTVLPFYAPPIFDSIPGQQIESWESFSNINLDTFLTYSGPCKAYDYFIEPLVGVEVSPGWGAVVPGPQPMTIVARVLFDDIQLAGVGMELAAFVDGTLVGKASSTGSYPNIIYNIQLANLATGNITFQLYDPLRQYKYNKPTTVLFQSGGNLGTISSPFNVQFCPIIPGIIGAGEVVIQRINPTWEGDIPIHFEVWDCDFPFRRDTTSSVFSIYSDPNPDIISAKVVQFQENSCREIYDVSSIDPIDSEGNGLSYSLISGLGGSDNNLVVLDNVTGKLNWTGFSPDFEMPGDSDQDNQYEIKIKVVNQVGLSDTLDLVITVTDNLQEGFTASINGGISSLCAVGSVLLTASSALSYQWNTGSTAASIVSAQAGIYTVTVTNSSQCTASASIVVNAGPTIQASGNLGVVCQGDEIQLTSTSTGLQPLTYSWTGPNNFVSSQEDPGPLLGTVLASGVYRVTVTDQNNCSASSSTTVVVSVATPPTASIALNQVCVGEVVQPLATVFGGSAPYIYSWVGPNGFSSNLLTPSSFIASTASNGIYTFIVTDNNGCKVTTTTSLAVFSRPQVAISSPLSVCQGSQIQLESTPIGGGGSYSFFWTGPNGFSSFLEDPNGFTATSAASGTYSVVVTDNNGCTILGTRTISVSSQVAPSVQVFSNTPVCIGNSIQLSSLVVGESNTLTYHWSGPSGYGSQLAQPVSFNSSIHSAGLYTLSVTDAAGCIGTASAVVQLNAVPTISATVNSPVCVGSTVFLQSSPGVGSYTFSWSGPSGFSSTIEDPLGFISSVSAAGTYTITVTDGNGCSKTATTSLQIKSQPLISTSVGPTCEGRPMLLSSTPSGGTPPYVAFLWAGPGGYSSTLEDPGSIILNTSSEGVYTVTVTDNAGCMSSASRTIVSNPTPSISASNTGPVCVGSPIAVSSSPSGGTLPYTYSWQGPSGFSATFEDPAAFTALVNGSGNYGVTLTDSKGCSATGISAVVVRPKPVIIAGNNGPLCFGTEALLTADVSGGSGVYSGYNWTGPNTFSSTVEDPPGFIVTGTIASGIYTITVTDNLGCTGTASTTLGVSNGSAPTGVASSNSPICVSSDLLLNVSVTGGVSPYTYSWSGPNNYSASIKSPLLQGALSAASGTYTVTISDSGGCSTTASTTVLVSGATIAMNKTDVTCAGGNNGSASVSHSGGNPPYLYTWNNGGTTSEISGLTAGTYHVTLTPAGASTCTQVGTIVVSQTTGLSVTISSITAACSGTLGTATALASGGTPSFSYLWPPTAGNQTTATAVNLPSGTYVVTVTDAVGCTGTASASIITGIGVAINPIVNLGPICPGAVVASIPLSSTPSNSGVIYNWSGGVSAGLANGTSGGTGPIIPAFVAGMTEGVYTVQVTATYNNCVSPTSFQLTISDNTGPVISNCPTNLVINTAPGLCGGVLTWQAPTATDDCGSVQMTQNGGAPSGTILPVGTNQLITYTASDLGGNTSTCAFTVSVVDNEVPSINCPSSPQVRGTNNENCTYTPTINEFNATANDNCGLQNGVSGLSFVSTGALSISGTTMSGISIPVGTSFVTWTAKDLSNNTKTCFIQVIVNDDDVPQITACPSNQDVFTTGNGSGDCTGIVPDLRSGLSINDNCTLSSSHVITQVPTPGSTIAGHDGDQVVVVFTVSDLAGNFTFCSAILTIKDDESPVFINCPGTIVLNNDVDLCGANVFFTPPGASDNCSGQVVITQIDGPSPGTFVSVGTILPVTFKAEDAAGNFSNCLTLLTVEDSQKPDLICPSGIQNVVANASCFFEGNQALNPSFTDNCASEAIINDYNNSSSLVGEQFQLGQTVVVWTAEDTSGNISTCSYMVSVSDETSPAIITCPIDRTIFTSLGGSGDCSAKIPDLVSEVVVSDNCASEAQIIIEQNPVAGTNFVTANGGSQLVVLSCTDVFGNFSTCETRLTLEDDELPILQNCPVDIQAFTTDQYPCYAVVTWTHPSYFDNCSISSLDFRIFYPGGAVYGPVNFDPLNASFNFEVGTSVVTYQVEDQNSNTATCSFEVVINSVNSVVGDFIWEDLDGNGQQDPGEPGLSGITVILSGVEECSGLSVSSSVISDINGYYKFENITPGQYQLQFSTPLGYFLTEANQGGSDLLDSDVGAMGLSPVITIAIGDTLMELDAGYYKSASIGDTVWEDMNGNGIQDIGEPGIGGVLVQLSGSTGSGIVVSRSELTDSTGGFMFEDLVPGSYSLGFVTPVGGYLLTSADDVDGMEWNDSDASVVLGGITVVEELISGEENRDYDAGYYRGARIGDNVWLDSNGNGIQDLGEVGLSGVEVRLTGTDGQGIVVDRDTITGIDGTYIFSDLLPGLYQLEFLLPVGYNRATYLNEGSNSQIDSDADPANGNMTTEQLLLSGAFKMNIDAGFVTNAAIGNLVWHDYDSDGIKDQGEPGIGGVTVSLTGSTGNGTPVNESQVTASDGTYLFSDLFPGAYQLGFATPLGYLSTIGNLAGASDLTDSDANPITGITDVTVISSGESQLSWYAGYFAIDCGDLPLSYGTSLGLVNGASHVIDPGLILGTCVDAEMDGQADSLALGDDEAIGALVFGLCGNNTTDEGGIQWITPLVQGAEACIQVTAVNNIGSTAVLQGWIDFNGDGDLMDVGEELVLTDSGLIPAGGVSATVYCFPVPASATFKGGKVFARFRLSPGGNLTPIGRAIGGEVEDYQLRIGKLGNLVWNDQNFNGTQEIGEPGIANVIVQLVWAGPDGDLQTVQDNHLYQTHTDISGKYTFCGVLEGNYGMTAFTPPMMVPTRVDIGGSDFKDSDGVFVSTDFGQVFSIFSINNASNMPVGEDGNGDENIVVGYLDAQADESHDFGFGYLDFGDLPEAADGQAFKTTLLNSGAVHVVNARLTLGSCIDAERDGQSDDDAGVYDGLSFDTGDGDDGINTVGIDAQDCSGIPFATVSAASYQCDNKLVVKKVNNFGKWVFYLVNGDFSLDISAAGGLSSVVGSTLVVDGGPVAGGFNGNLEALVFCIAQAEGISTELVQFEGVLTTNFVCFDKVNPCEDDESGIEFITPLIPGNEACILVSARNATGANTILQGWVDWDGNKQIESVEELQFINGGIIPDGGVMSVPFCFEVPDNVQYNEGRIYARFRISDNGGLLPEGPDLYGGASIPSGEVEDYILEVGLLGNRIWEDRNFDGIQGVSQDEPGMNGVIVQLEWAGPDGELASPFDNRVYTQTTTTINGDDGLYYFRGLINGIYRLRATLPADFMPTLINQGVDNQLDADDFIQGVEINLSDVSALVLNEQGVGDMPGGLLNFPDAHDDQSFDMGFVAVDFGDLPDSYATSFSGGAHSTVVPGLYLGSGVDIESTGLPDFGAGTLSSGGDDYNYSSYSIGGVPITGDDEDGFRLMTPLIPGYEACVEIKTTVESPYSGAFVGLWIDFEGDGQFGSLDNIIFTSVDGVTINSSAPLVPTGQLTRRYCFMVPESANFEGGQTYIRLRLNASPALLPTGFVPFGEVEDYWQPLSLIGNYVWMDSDLEGDQDSSEMTLSGVPLQLSWIGEDQVFNTADDRVYTISSDTAGRYQFRGLIPGAYKLTPVKYLGGNNPVSSIAPIDKILTIPNYSPTGDFRDSDADTEIEVIVPDLITIFHSVLEDGVSDNNGMNGFPDHREDLSIDIGFVDIPSIASSLSIKGVDKASSGICGHFDVILELCIKNSGKTPLNQIRAILDIGSSTAFGNMFLGLVPTGAPQITSTSAQQTPSINMGYNGGSEVNLLQGTDGVLWPGEFCCIRARFELNPSASGIPSDPELQALVEGLAVNYQNLPIFDFFNSGLLTVFDLSDDGDDPLSSNPLFPGDTGGRDDATPLTDCWQNSQPLIQNDIVSISLDTTCQVLITSDMVLEGAADDCAEWQYSLGGYYKVTVKNLTTGAVLPNPVTANYLNQVLLVEVEHIVSCNKIFGKVRLEDKLAPVLHCPVSTTVACSEDTTPLQTGQVTVFDCSNTTVVVDDELVDLGSCGNPRSEIIRTFIVTDDWGNQALCSHTITVMGFEFADLVMPADITIDCETAYQNTLATDPLSTGAPSINGAPIGQGGWCATSISYTDEYFAICVGSYELYRTWKVASICLPPSSTNPVVHTQRIRVEDFGGPQFSCPDNITVSVDPGSCCATAPLPDIIISEGCSSISNLEAKVTGVDPSTGNITTFTINGILIDFPGNNYGVPDTLVHFSYTQCLPNNNTYSVRYTATDACENSSTCVFQLTVLDLVPPVATCDEWTQVALAADGTASISAASFDAGSQDYCSPTIDFKARRMDTNVCQTDTLFHDDLRFCCGDVGDTLTIVLRVCDLEQVAGSLRSDDFYGNYSECMVQVLVEDKIKPVCTAPPSVTVSCDAFDSSLATYGFVTALDNCQIDTVVVDINYIQFDTICNKGTIVRRWTASDRAGNEVVCSQKITVTYSQHFYVKFPDDKLLTECDGTGNFGEPAFYSAQDCELMTVSYTDELFTLIPDVCFKIERHWTVLNWCQYSPNGLCVDIPNPEPSSISNSAQNRVGVVVSEPGTTIPSWESTVVAVYPGTSPVDYSTYWSPNVNCYRYTQVIKIIDHQAPTLVYPLDSILGDLSANDPLLWNADYWMDQVHMVHDLSESEVDIEITGTDACSGANIRFSYLLFLDLDGDGTQETVVNSHQQPGYPYPLFNNVQYNNLNTPDYLGGESRAFDNRFVSDLEKWGFSIYTAPPDGNNRTAQVAWVNQLGESTTPQLPLGSHVIQWNIEDGCGNETVINQAFEVKDTKAPTITCINGLAVNLVDINGGTAVMYASDFLQYAEDNCTPSTQLRFAVRKSGSGSGFPLNSDGAPQSELEFTCSDLGTQLLELWSEDAVGNADYCETYVLIQDNTGICMPVSGMATISGEVQTEEYQAVEDVSIELAGMSSGIPIFGQVFSGISGDYLFSNTLPVAANATLTPLLDSDPLNGVNTWDLVLISRHILGLSPITSPYKLIAADANKSGTVTTLDIVELRKLILGTYALLPNNSSWRFVDAQQQFSQVENPFADVIRENIQLANVQNNISDGDFIGIKIGDIDGNASPNHFVDVEVRSLGVQYWEVEDRILAEGEVCRIHFSAIEEVEAFQYTLILDDLELIELLPGEGMETAFFGVFQDAITVSAFETRGDFILVCRSQTKGKLSDRLKISNKITNAVAFNGIDQLEVAIRFVEKGKHVDKGVGFEAYQNSPNPWVQKTNLGFYTPVPMRIQLRVLDQLGRPVYTQEKYFEKGYHFWAVDKTAIENAGVYYYELKGDLGTGVGRMILLKN